MAMIGMKKKIYMEAEHGAEPSVPGTYWTVGELRDGEADGGGSLGIRLRPGSGASLCNQSKPSAHLGYSLIAVFFYGACLRADHITAINLKCATPLPLNSCVRWNSNLEGQM